ncbi:hypothetical protein COCC4DRAFT_45899 [Bipolaris maydis ATCC 48331]|uniref:ABA 3 protein n=2 Tax=Cochliobolus heterostrophus TaxID=5016 RepID=M2U421_COCH5|nr:uncharacterized protein COCC4DRAFT_45899 [Bipolaris maydis ATCC 48331]EMD88486.1 hypothetical protein COCHEDRAFT_1181539 [Bipolaris maydis C5]KAJ5026338.1 hypothetical protein J3E73DRAFT_233885 [Bipolaris maydis]ENH98634.1 hypothetical protein COCC4DRAFT_45899 [Bipolaris maydis ATCC 48331]KAJ5033273.1 hypothetical protein J3E74DRAFT_423756 [Bipolaris maydis]KAJ5051416.1 hypothetical protein J3E74DRAFT_469642 [Bipolaris maydis]
MTQGNQNAFSKNNQNPDPQYDETITEKLVVVNERWYYPPDIANDLKDVDLPFRVKEEVFATAWEYTRCVIPEYTNWSRYVAFMRTIVVGIIAEFRGSLIDVVYDDRILGYSLTEVLNALCGGTVGHAEMCREYRCFILISSQKSSDQTNTMLFRRYSNALSKSPWQFFRMRDTDALARFTIGAALACNNLDHIWFTAEQFDIMAEIGNTMYDGVAYYKHRSEGEVNSTFAYVPESKRVSAFHKCREALWALDVAWAKKPERKCVINFLRYFGGPIHVTMRRYRFVEEGLTLGKPDTKHVIAQTRKNVKLWNRLDEQKDIKWRELRSLEQYRDVLAREEFLLFNGLRAMLEEADQAFCSECNYREIYGAPQDHTFGGVFLCSGCQQKWAKYTESVLERMTKSFPEAEETIRISEVRANSSIAP